MPMNEKEIDEILSDLLALSRTMEENCKEMHKTIDSINGHLDNIEGSLDRIEQAKFN
jgi:hypothetical protein